MRNGARWIEQTLKTIFEQNLDDIRLELSIYNDGSTASDQKMKTQKFYRSTNFKSRFVKDETDEIIETWRNKLETRMIVSVHGHQEEKARGGEKRISKSQRLC